MQMPHRRKTALATFAIVLAPVLSSCGFDYATDYENSITVGSNDRSASVDVLGAHVVSDQAGRGVFIASLANNDGDEAIELTSLTSEQADVSAFAPIEVAAHSLVNLDDTELESIQVTDPGTEFGEVATSDEHADEAHAEKSASKPGEKAHAKAEAYDPSIVVQPGKHVRVTVTFSTKETVTLNVPVVRNCGYYANIAGVAAGPEVCPGGADEKQAH